MSPQRDQPASVNGLAPALEAVAHLRPTYERDGDLCSAHETIKGHLQALQAERDALRAERDGLVREIARAMSVVAAAETVEADLLGNADCRTHNGMTRIEASRIELLCRCLEQWRNTRQPIAKGPQP